MKAALIILTLIPTTLLAQVPVTDHANNGQLKRMVATKWNDWKPTPDMKKIIGIGIVPKNPAGWTYWRILHHRYWKGPDRRPYRAGGPFEKNYASLLLQKKDDEKIADSIYKVFQIHFATYTNMSGGVADMPWNIYFKKVFKKLFSQIPKLLQDLVIAYPIAFEKFTASENYKKYMKYLDMTKDRVKAIHEAFNDKGGRIISYLKIMDEMGKKNDYIAGVINAYLTMTKTIPDPEKYDQDYKLPENSMSDKEIVTYILSNYNF